MTPIATRLAEIRARERADMNEGPIKLVPRNIGQTGYDELLREHNRWRELAEIRARIINDNAGLYTATARERDAAFQRLERACELLRQRRDRCPCYAIACPECDQTDAFLGGAP